MAELMMNLASRFLEAKRIAFVGLSHEPRHFSRYVFNELVARGYDVVPVNPTVDEVAGQPAFASVRDVSPPPQAVLVMTPASRALEVAYDCLAAGVRRVWFHRGVGPGAGNAEAVALLRANGVQPVTNLCPFMALPGGSWFHSAHGFFRGAKRMSVQTPRLPSGGSPALGGR